MGSALLSVLNLTKTFPNGVKALDGIDLEVSEGEFVSIVGPSGCGKSTLLRIIAGLIPTSQGTCHSNGRGDQAFVFQEPTLLPWRNVQRNAELLLELEGYRRDERSRLAADALRLVHLDGFESSYPDQLSGGMKMRLSLARALALRPQLFLMDEPFSALDEITRELLNDELLGLWESQRFTGLFVTHNVAEAIYLSNRVAVMSARPGRILETIQVDFPYPRSLDLRATPEFARMTGHVSGLLRKAHDA